ncbi:tRNA glutamyl-Q(34) synthetase GluQRS [Uliginosibacterium gangwonense]|uniref:tRNA glutamyl-Q(34) synthetase GluQRS n=1 Tax=Uliginosibacterium gangwonense TaxID=392736 RepID=UPI000A063EF9|nr:tRNA glutamyl-Q(34) synthetase GluQRS [Uliginosibacterium gangwonense]
MHLTPSACPAKSLGPAPRAPCIGRFAPSPTGPLHFGSLVAALGSCLEARHQGGQWLLRIEDVDAPRTIPGATDAILHQLEALGFCWDGEVVYQSQRLALYQQALDQLIASRKAFPCACTRRELADSTLAPDGSRRYPGTCRDGLRPEQQARAWRLRTEPGLITWEDAIQGVQQEDVFRDVGDFVLLRADGQYAYQLAVVVDDALQGVTHVVRGADLLGSTARQIFLHKALGLAVPAYTHLPVATNAAGEKLSKQTLAQAVDTQAPVSSLYMALCFLGQHPPADLAQASLPDIWAWSHTNWSQIKVPRAKALIAPAQMLHNSAI